MTVLEIFERVVEDSSDDPDDHLVLDHGQREKARFKAVSRSGLEVRVFLDRGQVLVPGEVLRTSCGKNIEVLCAKEKVLTARTNSWRTFSRACYHLGNRHVKLQVGDCWLRISPDHVLSEMLSGLGLEIAEEFAEFVPESGAYAKHISQGADHHRH